jgi:hydroxymethylpyrimidine pyrophosphatase-like HAD family hydrolase
MSDPYLKDDTCVDRLVAEYKQHNSIVIAYDFDDTVYDFHKKGRKYTDVITLLRRAKDAGCYLIVWTGNEDMLLVEDYLRDHSIPFDALNENPSFMAHKTAKKIYANLYLDDRAGLSAAYHQLECMLDLVKPQAT